MFYGTHEHTMSDTGRVSIPSKFRDVCKNKHNDETLMITNYEKYLVAYPVKEWKKILKNLSKLSRSEDVRKFSRYFIGGAGECPIDKQGRVLIPQPLITYANIDKDIVMVGLETKFEIWSKEIWKEEVPTPYEVFKKSSDSLGEELEKVGL